MAVRNIVVEGEEVLRKRCKEVPEVNDRIRQILDDMVETMRDAEGVGLAAPQVGILRRMFVVETEEDGLFYVVNPEIIEVSGEKNEAEGCLSLPGMIGEVVRPTYVKMKALDRDGNPVEYEARDFLAKAFCHEFDHLEGILFKDKATNYQEVSDDEYDEEWEDEE